MYLYYIHRYKCVYVCYHVIYIYMYIYYVDRII
jgi:hypothetical protein